MNFKNIILLLTAVAVSVGPGFTKVWNTKADRPLAYVRKFKPKVRIDQGPQTIKARRAVPLYSGDTLFTNKNGLALVQFMDKSIVKVQPNTRLIVKGKIEGKQNAVTRIILETGEIFQMLPNVPAAAFRLLQTRPWHR